MVYLITPQVPKYNFLLPLGDWLLEVDFRFEQTQPEALGSQQSEEKWFDAFR